MPLSESPHFDARINVKYDKLDEENVAGLRERLFPSFPGFALVGSNQASLWILQVDY